MNGQEWEIRSAADCCLGCGTAFAHEETFLTRLCFAPGQGYERRDYCGRCAEGLNGDGPVSMWKTVFHKTPPPPEALKKETAESLLRELIETNDAARLNVIFVLAVMLERRRIFVERDVQVLDDGVKRRIYEHKGTGETFIITDPQLRLSDLEHVQSEVVTLLGGGDRKTAVEAVAQAVGQVAGSPAPAAAPESAGP